MVSKKNKRITVTISKELAERFEEKIYSLGLYSKTFALETVIEKLVNEKDYNVVRHFFRK